MDSENSDASEEVAGKANSPRLVLLPTSKSLAFSDRQMEALRLAAVGIPNREIATTLSVSPANVRDDLFVVATKVGATSRKDMIRFAKRLDLLGSDNAATRAETDGPGGSDARTRR